MSQPPTFNYVIGSLSAVLTAEGHETSLLKLSNHKFDSAIEAIGSCCPDLIAVSCTSLHWEFIKKFAQMVKGKFDLPIFVGGSHTTMFPEALLETRFVDGICRGEGEFALRELVDKLNKGVEYRNVSNFWFRNKDEIIRNKVRPLIDDLDALPFADRTIFPKKDILRYTNFTFSRGCPYNCSYCCNHALKEIYKGKGATIRFRSVKHTLQEVKHVTSRYNPSQLYFDDDTFTKNREWLEEFCLKYPKLSSLPFYCNTRPELLTRKIAMLLKSAGCAGVNIGIESGDEALRKRVLNRNMSNEQIIDAFKIAKECGLKTFSFNMIGIPGETPSMFQKTIELNQVVQPDELQLTTYYPFPGSRLGDFCKGKGYINKERLLSSCNYMTDSVLQLPSFSCQDINRLRRWFECNVYSKYSTRKALGRLLLYLLPPRLKDNAPSPLIKLYGFLFQ